MAKLLIPTALRSFTDGLAQIEVEQGTVSSALASLAAQYPDIKQHLFDEDGALRSYVNIFVGDENIREFGGLDAPVKEDDTVTLVPAIAGGADPIIKTLAVVCEGADGQ